MPLTTARDTQTTPSTPNTASGITGGGGRSSGRPRTIGRVAAGAVASKVLGEMGIRFLTYTRIHRPRSPSPDSVLTKQRFPETLCTCRMRMPPRRAQEYLKQCMSEKDSSGGVIEVPWSPACPRAIGVKPSLTSWTPSLAKAHLLHRCGKRLRDRLRFCVRCHERLREQRRPSSSGTGASQKKPTTPEAS